MTPCPVSIASDMTSSTASHTVLIPNRDTPCPMNWEPGHLTGTHSIAPTVLHKGSPLVTAGHDLGPLMLHLVHDLLTEMKSSRKMAFAASTVVASKTPVACASGAFPMLACGDITLPVGINESNPTHSVIVGMTDYDINIGWYDVTSGAIVDALCFAKGVSNLTVPNTHSVAEDAFGLDPFKSLVNVPVVLGRSVLVSWHNDWKTPIGTRLGLGGGAASGSREWSYDPGTHGFAVKDSFVGPGGSIEDASEFTPDGVRSRTTVKTPLGGGGEKAWGDKL